MLKNPRNSRNETRWPISQMLLHGTFGTGTAIERRYRASYTIVLIVMWSWIFLAFAYHRNPFPGMRIITVLLPGPIFSYLAWEKRRYFLSLDELTRRIELEAMAYAYAIGVLGTLWAGGIAYALSLWWSLDPHLISWIPFFCVAMLLASVKGAYRYFATRRY